MYENTDLSLPPTFKIQKRWSVLPLLKLYSTTSQILTNSTVLHIAYSVFAYNLVTDNEFLNDLSKSVYK